MKIVLLIFLIIFNNIIFAEPPTRSPNPGWSEMQVQETTRPTVLTQVLLWVPNRIADLVDIIRVDVGAGPSVGAVVRLSENFQFGYRVMHPMSVRVGAFGRNYPWLIETSDEMGVTPRFQESLQRKVCGSEIGVGADLLIVGGYGGICLQEIADFFAGVFFMDLNDDDWQ